MTMLYVYGIVDSPTLDGDPLKGHGAACVFAVPCADCAAVASDLPRGSITATARSVWLHEQVLAALMRRHGVLPLRFGTIVPDAEMLRGRLAAMHRALADDLQRLRGRVEFALRVTGVDAEYPRAREAGHARGATAALTPGRSYLRARAARWRERTAFGDAAKRTERALRRDLDPAAENAAWGLATRPSASLIASYLVARDRTPAFAGKVADVRARHPGLAISCTGPWAPYSFVTVRPWEGWS